MNQTKILQAFLDLIKEDFQEEIKLPKRKACKICGTEGTHTSNTCRFNFWPRLNLYDLSLEEFNQLLEKQNNSCGICGKSFEEYRNYIDHDHVTGKVRGLLCSGCNTGLGKFGDNIEGLMKAIYYLLQS